jgi:hypothetical protein
MTLFRCGVSLSTMPSIGSLVGFRTRTASRFFRRRESHRSHRAQTATRRLRAGRRECRSARPPPDSPPPRTAAAAPAGVRIRRCVKLPPIPRHAVIAGNASWMIHGTLVGLASGRGVSNHFSSRPTFVGSVASSQPSPSRETTVELMRSSTGCAAGARLRGWRPDSHGSTACSG